MRAEFYDPELQERVTEFKELLHETNWLEFAGFIIVTGIVLFDICAILLFLS